MVELSVKLAALLGKPVVRPTPQGVLYGRALDIRAVVGDALSGTIMAKGNRQSGTRPIKPVQVPHAQSVDSGPSYTWFKCSEHDTWMQPECKPFDHWRCVAQGCSQVKAAKKRTAIERRIFNLHRWQVAEYERNGY